MLVSLSGSELWHGILFDLASFDFLLRVQKKKGSTYSNSFLFLSHVQHFELMYGRFCLSDFILSFSEVTVKLARSNQ